MKEKEIGDFLSLLELPIVSSKEPYEDYLEAVNADLPEAEQLQLLDKLIVALQQEADKLPSPARELWFNMQLVKAYINSGQWEEARTACDDGMELARQVGQGTEDFQRLGEIIQAHEENDE